MAKIDRDGLSIEEPVALWQACEEITGRACTHAGQRERRSHEEERRGKETDRQGGVKAFTVIPAHRSHDPRRYIKVAIRSVVL
jgi:hypothetical protein